jgi:hypothetical protein
VRVSKHPLACDAVAVDVRAAAAERGYQLDKKPLDGRLVWAWHRGDDDRHPCFQTEREALTYMEDWLQRVAMFEQYQSPYTRTLGRRHCGLCGLDLSVAADISNGDGEVGPHCG